MCPADVRLGQLETNLVRLRAMSGFLGDRYVMVNIPAAEIEAVRNDRVDLRHKAIVGKIDRQTPILSSKIHEVILAASGRPGNEGTKNAVQSEHVDCLHGGGDPVLKTTSSHNDNASGKNISFETVPPGQSFETVPPGQWERLQTVKRSWLSSS